MEKYVRNNSALSLAKKLNITSWAVEKNIKVLKDQGLLIRHGAARGFLEIKEEFLYNNAKNKIRIFMAMENLHYNGVSALFPKEEQIACSTSAFMVVSRLMEP